MYMANAQRTDPHRPGAIIPAHYTSVLDFSLPSSAGGGPVPGFRWDCEYDRRPGKFTEFGFVPEGPMGAHPEGADDCCAKRYLETHKAARHGTPGKCDVCGAHYVYGTLYVHTPSGEAVLMGHDCADKYGAMYDASAAELHRERAVAALAKAIARKQNAEAREKYMDEHPGLREAFALLDAPDQTPRQLGILRDMREKLVQYKSLSEKQIAFALRLADEVRNPKPKAEERPAVPAPRSSERICFTGKIVHTKWVDSDFGGALKMLVVVDTPEGQWKGWGTVPSAIDHSPDNPLVGRVVELCALVQPKQGEPSFAFLKRPTWKAPPKPKKPRPTKAQKFQGKAREWFRHMQRQASYWGGMDAALQVRTSWYGGAT